VLGQKDPTPALLALLANPEWTDKNLVLFELARLADPRAVATVARVLRDSPKNYFSVDPQPQHHNTTAIEHGLDAIAHTGTAEARRELIGLLGVDLARFGSYVDRAGFQIGSYVDRAGFQRIVAAHLIELTGESFGVDADAWRKWQGTHSAYRVNPNMANPRSAFRINDGKAIDLGN
jgi:hypothetical protein